MKMNRLIIPLTISILMGSPVMFGQTNMSQQLNQKWLVGQRQEVLDFANQRLQQNTNDIVGLVLKMDYQIEFLDLENMTNTMVRVLQVGSTITTTNFSAIFPRFQEEINFMQGLVPSYPPAELAADRAKVNITGRPLPHIEILKALEKDGYFR